MPDSFHLFPFLPRELRDAIWTLAVRSPGPGAHIFRVYSEKEAEKTNLDRQYETDSSARGDRPFPAVAAPQCLPQDAHFTLNARASAPISWTGHNPSAYLIDSGLWTACKESRQVIEKVFRRHEWLALLAELDEAVCDDKTWRQPTSAEGYQKAAKKLLGCPFHMPATLLARDGPSDRYLTIFPGADLVILQIEPHDIGNIPWDVLRCYGAFPAMNAALRFYWRSSDPRSGLRYDQRQSFHYALEIDPSWNDKDRIDGLLLSQIVWAAQWETDPKLWIIDYQIKRRHHVPTKEQAAETERNPPVIFYGSDRRYVEVKAGCYPYKKSQWEGGRNWEGEWYYDGPVSEDEEFGFFRMIPINMCGGSSS